MFEDILYTVYFAFTVSMFYTTVRNIDIYTKEMSNLYKKCNVKDVKLFLINIMILSRIIVDIVKQRYFPKQSNIELVETGTHLEIKYTYKDAPYKIVMKKKKGPKKIMTVEANESDITDLFNSYVGPFEDFHGITYTPSDLSLENVAVYLTDGTEHIYSHNEKIIF